MIFILINNTTIDSIEQILGVGDAQQLPPVVKTHNKSRPDGTVVNEFADSQVLTIDSSFTTCRPSA